MTTSRSTTNAASATALLQRLEGVQAQGNGWRARCPACGGTSRKLSIAERDGRVLVNCFDCSDAEAVLAAVGLTWADIMPPRNWPASPEERRVSQRAIRDAGMASAVEVLTVEGTVLRIAARQLQGWQVLSQEDDERLALACHRIEEAAKVLTQKESHRPDGFYPPARLVSVKRDAVAELKRQITEAERQLEAAQASLDAFNRTKAVAA